MPPRKHPPRAAPTPALALALVYRGLVEEQLVDLNGVGRLGTMDAVRPWEGALPASFAAERDVVVELKYGPGPLPRWLDALGRARGVAYSKFGAACAHAARWSGAGA